MSYAVPTSSHVRPCLPHGCADKIYLQLCHEGFCCHSAQTARKTDSVQHMYVITISTSLVLVSDSNATSHSLICWCNNTGGVYQSSMEGRTHHRSHGKRWPQQGKRSQRWLCR